MILVIIMKNVLYTFHDIYKFYLAGLATNSDYPFQKCPSASAHRANAIQH